MLQVQRRRVLSATTLLFSFPLTAFIAACSGPESALIGKWKNSSEDEIEFQKDGSMRLMATKGRNAGMALTGKWRMQSDGKIDIDIAAAMGMTMVMTATLQNQTLTTSLAGEVSTYTKSK
jgi:hypothetical protein